MPLIRRSLLTCAVLACAAPACAPTANAATVSEASRYRMVLAKEAASKALCESTPGRLHVSYEDGKECVAYHITEGSEDQRSAVLFFDGDVKIERYLDTAAQVAQFELVKKGVQSWADRFKVRYVYVSRTGVNGSSGNHGDRRRPHESHIMNALVDRLKDKLGLDRVVLAGQSGGSTIAANILTFGRTDISCAILGSGAFALNDLLISLGKARGKTISRTKLEGYTYDPSSHIAKIKSDAARRVLFLGDPDDATTPFGQQVKFAEALREAGHHAGVIPVDAKDEANHGATRHTLMAAGMCARGMADWQIARAAKPKPKTEASAPNSSRTAATVASKAQ